MRPGGPVDLVQLFARAPPSAPRLGAWLAIPTDYLPLGAVAAFSGSATPEEMRGMGIELAVLAVRPRPHRRGLSAAGGARHARAGSAGALAQALRRRKRRHHYVAQFPEILAREINAAARSSAVLQRYGG